MNRIGLIARIAVFSALIYVLGLGTTLLPNVNPAFFIIFVAGMIWGLVPGVLVGAVGMGLWTLFHPFGPAMPPIMLAQVSGAAASGVIGAFFDLTDWQSYGLWRRSLILVLYSLMCTVLFYLPVTVVDAYLFQPFWPRFIGGLPWVLIGMASNAVIFPLLFPAARLLYLKERRCQ
ncbi:MAG TPA: hypothetical protein PLF13_12375 [candidate division Zixibacteria bacterium]|nr:hypothetical protein [candidate division Zixibacteria bacterium]